MGKPVSLRTIPLFNILTERERKKIADEVVESRYKKGQYIFRQGDPAKYFHVLQEGSVKCVKSSPDGKDVTLKVLMPGDLFCCEAAVFDGTPHPGCAMPMGDVSVLRLNKKTYFDVLRRNPDAAIEVIKYLGQRLNEAQEKTNTLALDRAESRIASLLVNLAVRSSVKDAQGLRLTIRLTRQDLADMAGITVETAIRIMGKLKKDRLVSGTAKQLVIHDLTALKHLATESDHP
ncbi:MAG: Crp/Fnr family transcriptional regulator [Nitrospirota bacterium]|nr:Crp/Fnr family transcriptional regulator [Nitrospirota bacterium]